MIRFILLLPWIIAVYQKVSYQTLHAENVFYEEKTVHNLGKARYQMDLVKSERFPITNEFAAAVCNLPQTYDRMAYHRFIKDWGTVGFWINFVTSLTFNLKGFGQVSFGQVFTMASVSMKNTCLKIFELSISIYCPLKLQNIWVSLSFLNLLTMYNYIDLSCVGVLN